MLPGAITIKTADPRMAAGRFTAYEDTTGKLFGNPFSHSLRNAISGSTLVTRRAGR